MTAMTDMTTIMETFLGRTVDGAQLGRIADAFIRNDPFGLAHWSDTLYQATGAEVLDGGTGYTSGDTLTIVGGTGTAAVFEVFSETGGVVTDLILTNQGSYSVPPTNPVSFTGGTGTGLTATASASQYEEPRDPTNEEKAQFWLDTMTTYGKNNMRKPAEVDEAQVQAPIAAAAVDAAGDAAEVDFE